MPSHRPRLAAALLATLVLPALAGCSTGTFAGTSPSASPSPTKTFSAGSASPSDDPGAGGTGPVANPDGSLQVCNALSLSTVKSVTGLKLVGSQEGESDSLPGSGYVTYSCIYYGADPASTSIVLYVYVGDANQVFHDNSDAMKPVFGWGPIDGIGDRAEGDGIHVLDVLWGSRYVISVVDNTDGSDVGVKNMAALATAVHQSIGA